MKLSKTYEPEQYESDIYALWEKTEAFTPKHRGSKQNHSIVLPPPNANGNLHLGHALTMAIQDAVSRYQRMQGKAVLWLPGADHAGFETQSVYEKQLAKAGKSRFDFSREELYQQIWEFVAENRENYETQFRRLGASVDWTHYTYTLDPKIVARSYATFKRLWEDKLIYRGERLVNYCTHHRTGFADIEVNYEEATTPLYYMKYGPFELATTRPETKFGDTAVAVHPEDKRYAKYVGTVVTVEGVNGPFEVQVIADEMVDMEFGTGVVKITPAHSFDDWEVAQRHNLPAVRVINHDGTMNHHAGRFEGMTVMEARSAVAEALEEKGLLIRVDTNYQNRMGRCYKCDTVIEPMLMDQWFIKMEPLAGKAIETLKRKEITFYPDSKRTQLITYLQGLNDWNISRQIAWGIPIPAFQNVDDSDDWIYDERVDQEIITLDGKNYRRDPDVFDTWFSSGQWPFATLDYPDSDDFKQFYPLDLMETGFDILNPWVARMIMLGLYVTDSIPFKNVYLHGLVLDGQGQKMSKSKGNVINPMEILDKFGSDALRMGLLTGQTPGSNQPFSEFKVVSARNFCNKLWNIARFIEDKIGDDFSRTGKAPKATSPADAWILNKLQRNTEVISAHFEQYRLSEAYEALYHLIWDDVADWYIEASKAAPNNDMLAYVLETILKLAHPFAPFVTETIWQTLAWEGDSVLAISKWPVLPKVDEAEAAEFEQIQAIVSEIRFIFSVLHIRKGIKLYHTGDELLQNNEKLIASLAKLDAITVVKDGQGLHLTSTPIKCWLDLDHNSIQTFLQHLKDKKAEQEKVVAQLRGRLANTSYVNNAPKAIVQETQDQLAEAEQMLTKVSEEFERFSR